MAWVEERKVGDRVYRYVYWRTRTRVDGKVVSVRHSRPVGEVPREAAAAMAEETALIEERRAPRPKHVGPSAALDAFLAEWRDVKRRKADTVDYYRKLLAPCFASLADRGPLRAWQPRWVVEYVAAHPAWAPRTVQMLLTSLRTFARWARSRGYECPDLARDVRGPTVTKAAKRAYSAAELRALLEASRGHRLEPAVALAALAGLSLGDLRALPWGAVDLKTGWIRWARSKTKRPILVPVSSRLREALDATPKAGKTFPVCTLPRSDSSAYKAFARLCARAGVDATGGWKRLRHTYATLLDAAGVDRATRRDLLGHAPGSSQDDVYVHTDPVRLAAAIAALDAAVSAPAPSAPPPRSRKARGSP